MVCFVSTSYFSKASKNVIVSSVCQIAFPSSFHTDGYLILTILAIQVSDMQQSNAQLVLAHKEFNLFSLTIPPDDAVDIMDW